MTEKELIAEEERIPELAVRALDAVHRRARASGRPVVMLVGRTLMRVTGETCEVLKELPPLLKVGSRTRRLDE